MNKIEYNPFRSEFPPSTVDLPKLKGKLNCKCGAKVRSGFTKIQTQKKNGEIVDHYYRKSQCLECMNKTKRKPWYTGNPKKP